MHDQHDQHSAILNRIDPHEVVRLTQELVSLRSENPPGSEAAVAQALGAYLTEAGLNVCTREVQPGRPNVVATLHGSGAGPTLLFTGHTDTMPVSGSWTADPFGGEIRDGKLFGRGAADMKGGLAAMAVAVKALAGAPVWLTGTLVFAAVVDEEKDGEGTRQLVRDGILADWAVIGEPTSNQPVIASNGQINFEFILRGQAGHASDPANGHNAIEDGVLLVNALRQFATAEFPKRSHPLLGPPSLSVGTFNGGVQTSIIPDECRITVDRRVVPGETVEAAVEEIRDMLQALHHEHAGFDARMNVLLRVLPVVIPTDSPLVTALRQAVHEQYGHDLNVGSMRATTDAATLWHDGGIPTVIMGPGSIEQAHAGDEFVEVRQLTDAARIYALAALNLLGKGEAFAQKPRPS